MKVAIYCRVSSAEQERRGTIEAQRSTLTAYAQREGYTVSAIYCDDGKSAGTGKLAERAAYARLLVAAERHEFEAVLVVNIDRLTRTDDLIERAAILGPLQRAGISVVTPSGTIDLRTFTGDLMAALEAAMAALERRKILERTQAGKDRILAAGGKPHGRTPYGLRYDRDRGWSVDASEADVIREIHKRVAGEESCVRIALDLHARKVPPPGKQWGHTSVWSLVRQARDRYAGTWLANERRGTRVPVPRILTDREIDRAELALHDHKRRGLEHRTRRVYLLDRHAATCALCGGWIGVRGHGGDREIGYTCRNRSHVPVGHPSRCSLPIIPVAHLDGLAWADLVEWLTSDAVYQHAVMLRRGRLSGKDTAHERWTAARERVAELDRKADALAGRVDALPASALTAALDRLAAERRDAERVAAEAALFRAGRTPDPAANPEALIESLRLRAASATSEERREIARTLLREPGILDRRRLTLRVGLPCPVSAGSSRSYNRAPVTLRILVAA